MACEADPANMEELRICHHPSVGLFSCAQFMVCGKSCHRMAAGESFVLAGPFGA